MTTDSDRVRAAIRSEVEKYHDDPFTDDDRFLEDMRLLSDDITEIALGVEKTLGVRLERKAYRSVYNVRTFAEAIGRHVAGSSAGE